MKIVNSYKYISIGIYVRFLWNMNVGDYRNDVIKYIDELIKELKDAEFMVSLSGCANLLELRSKISENLTKGNLLELEEKTELGHRMYILENIIYSEARTKSIYVVEDKRYTTKYLLEEPNKIFSEGIWQKLSDNSQKDFWSSFFCIAFSLGTAAAFHMLRATEDVFRNYYKYYIKKNRSKNLMWSQMLDQLKKKKTKKPNSRTLEVLDIIRNTYRNPTNHPEVFYDIDRCQDLLGLCVDAVSKMINEIS